MGNAKISELSSALMNQAIDSLTAAKGKKVEESFFSVLDNATKSSDSNAASDTLTTNDRREPTNVSETKETEDKPFADNGTEKATDKVQASEEKPVEKEDDQDVIQFIANQLGITMDELIQNFSQLQEQIAAILVNKLGISQEQLTSALQNLDITALDAAEPANLMNLMVELGFAQDASTVLTDENLYLQYRDILSEINESDMGLSKEQLGQIEQAISQLQQPVIAQTEKSVQEQPIQDEPGTIRVTGQTFEKPNPVIEVTTQPQSDSQEQSAKGETKEGGNQHMNFQNFINNLANAVEQSAAATPASEVFTGYADTESIISQIVEQIKVQVNADTTSMEMQLYPESYGKLNLHVAVKDGVVTAQMAVENEAARRAIETQVVQLREDLNHQGLKVEAIEVTVQTHEFEQNFEQQKDQSTSGQSQNHGSRSNINLNLPEEELSQEQTESEELTRRIMEQNGNRVDFSA